jgi:hypothetical protein
VIAAVAAALCAATPAAALRTQAHFRSPSGNINCYLSDGRLSPAFVDCLVARNAWHRLPSKPRACDVDFYPAEIALGANGRVSVGSCRGDVGPACLPTAGFGCTTLAYGRSIRSRHFVCRSARNGVTCTLRGRGVGFRISREGYVVLR